MRACRVFQIGKPIVHPNNSRLEDFLELQRLFRILPKPEVRMIRQAVLNDEIPDTVLQPFRPPEDAFDTGRIGRHNAHGGERDVRLRHVRVHFLKPIVGDLARSRSHISARMTRGPSDR